MYNKFNVGDDDITGHLSHGVFESGNLFSCSMNNVHASVPCSVARDSKSCEN